MYNTPETQSKFLAAYGPIYDLQDHFNALLKFMQDRAKTQKVDGQLIDNRLLGLEVTGKLATSNYIGESVKSYVNRTNFVHRKTDFQDQMGYAGNIWFRLEKELGDYSAFFNGSMLHVGGGGYSTWNGPWQEYGQEITKLEVGVPWALRRPLPAYAFNTYFYVSDFPDIDQFAIMQKLGDEELPTEIKFSWQDDDLEENDRQYLDFLKNYKEKANV